jgi:hypothetical protein
MNSESFTKVSRKRLAMSLWTDQETKDLAKTFGAVALL